MSFTDPSIIFQRNTGLVCIGSFNKNKFVVPNFIQDPLIFIDVSQVRQWSADLWDFKLAMSFQAATMDSM